jgi:fumarylacetoacetate (FAA) hydrolase
MIFASVKDSTLDGKLYLINKDHTLAIEASPIVKNLREALEQWEKYEPALKELEKNIHHENKNVIAFSSLKNHFHSPLPRSFGWLDGSSFLHHVRLVRKARQAEIPSNLTTLPLMYQGGSDSFLGPHDDIPLIDVKDGLDFEAEVAIVTDFVPMGTKAPVALKHVKLIMLVNDVTLRGIAPIELAQGFGFLQSKPSSAFSPLALTPDELGEYWKEGRVHLPLETFWNGKFFGRPQCHQMHFSFAQLIEHAARTRHLTAGTIIGSGTVSNEEVDEHESEVGSSCIVEKRTLEQLKTGSIQTPYMQVGDQVKIQMHRPDGFNLFGSIEQKVVAANI